VRRGRLLLIASDIEVLGPLAIYLDDGVTNQTSPTPNCTLPTPHKKGPSMSGPLRVQWARSTQQPRASAIGTRDGDRQHLDSVGSSGRYEQISMLGSKSRQAKHQQEATHLRHLDATVSISNLDSSISLLMLHLSDQLWAATAPRVQIPNLLRRKARRASAQMKIQSPSAADLPSSPIPFPHLALPTCPSADGRMQEALQ